MHFSNRNVCYTLLIHMKIWATKGGLSCAHQLCTLKACDMGNMMQGEAGKAQRSKHDQQHRDNLVRLRGEKQREVDRLKTGLEDCQACLAVSQAKEQALASRKRMLEKEV